MIVCHATWKRAQGRILKAVSSMQSAMFSASMGHHNKTQLASKDADLVLSDPRTMGCLEEPFSVAFLYSLAHLDELLVQPSVQHFGQEDKNLDNKVTPLCLSSHATSIQDIKIKERITMEVRSTLCSVRPPA